MQQRFRGLSFVRMTDLIGPRSAIEADGAVPARYFDRSGQEVSSSEWEVLREDPAYRQVRITNITGLARGGFVYIRVHTVWTGIGVPCGPPCAASHLYETRVFDSFAFLPSLGGWTYDLTNPWPWANAVDAVQGHDAIVRELLQHVPEAEAIQDEKLSPTLDLEELYAQRLG